MVMKVLLLWLDLVGPLVEARWIGSEYLVRTGRFWQVPCESHYDFLRKRSRRNPTRIFGGKRDPLRAGLACPFVCDFFTY